MKENLTSFWETLPKPFFVLAPMEDVTDAAFRRIIASRGKPHVFMTEFTSADGLVRADEKGQKKLRAKLMFGKGEAPVVAQLFSSRPEYMQEAARIAASLGVAGIDINMGCPDKTVEKQGAGAALIKTPKLAVELIRAAKKGAAGLPVSVKTRLGYYDDQLEEWLPVLLSEEPAAITLHARTRKEMSKVPARWERIKRGVEIRNETHSKTLILGNGDVTDLKDAREKASYAGCDGVMLGRAIYGNPWLFSEYMAGVQDKLDALREHILLFDELLGECVAFATMKKHFKAYVSGFDQASFLRDRLMHTNSAQEALEVIDKYHP